MPFMYAGTVMGADVVQWFIRADAVHTLRFRSANTDRHCWLLLNYYILWKYWHDHSDEPRTMADMENAIGCCGALEFHL